MNHHVVALQEAHLGTPLDGHPTKVREGVIRSINTDGTLGVVARVGRKMWEGLAAPAWYTPALGDLVLVALLDGDRQRPVVLCPLWAADRTAPMLRTAGATGNVTLAKLTEGGKTGKLTVKDGLVTAIENPS